MMSNYDGTSDPTIYEDGDILCNPAFGILYLSPIRRSGSQFSLSNQCGLRSTNSVPSSYLVGQYWTGICVRIY